MPLRFVSVLLVLLAMGLATRAQARDPETMGILKDRAENFVQCMLKGSVNSIAGEMHPALRRTYSNEVVRNVFGDLHRRGGRFEEMGEASMTIGRNTSVIVLIPLQYANNTVTARVVFERAGRYSRISEFAIIPFTEHDPASVWRDPEAPPPPAKPLPSPPYANSLLFNIEKVEIAREGMEPLKSSLYMPTIATASAPVPAVILLSEATTTGAPPMVGSSNPLRDLAEGLATRGVAVLMVVPQMGIEEIELAETIEEIDPNEELYEGVETIEPTPSFSEEQLILVYAALQERAEIDGNRSFVLTSGDAYSALVEQNGVSSSVGYLIGDIAGIEAEKLAMGRRRALLRPDLDEDVVHVAMGGPLEANTRIYPNSGPYLIEEIHEEDAIRYGHVHRAVIDDLAHYARMGRMPQ